MRLRLGDIVFIDGESHKVIRVVGLVEGKEIYGLATGWGYSWFAEGDRLRRIGDVGAKRQFNRMGVTEQDTD